MIVNFESYQVKRARLEVVKHLKSIQSKNKVTKSKAIASFLQSLEAGKLSEAILDNIADANAKGRGGLSRATLHRWWKAVEDNTTLEPKRYGKIESYGKPTNSKSNNFTDEHDKRYALAIGWKWCRERHSGNVNWLIPEQQALIETLDIKISQKTFLHRVLVGEVISEYARITEETVSEVCQQISISLELHDDRVSPFPVRHTIFPDVNGKDLKPRWGQKKLAEEEGKFFHETGQLFHRVPHQEKVRLFAKEKRCIEKLYFSSLNFIDNNIARSLFMFAATEPYEEKKSDNIKRSLLKWIDEAKVPDLTLVNDFSYIDTVEQAAAASRLLPDLGLPLSKDEIRKMVSGGLNIAEYFAGYE